MAPQGRYAPDPLLYLDASTVESLCDTIDPVVAIRDAFAAIATSDAAIFPEAAMRWIAADGTAARSLVLPARYRDAYGCKVINACIGNVERGIPRAHGLIVLHDPQTAAPACILEGGRISALRTAAVSIVAVGALGRLEDVRSAGFVGCGRQAMTHLELLVSRCRPERIAVHDIDRGRADAFAAKAGTLAPTLDVVVSPDAAGAVRGAALVVAATTTTTAYVELDWLDPGATFVNVSLDDATEELLLGCDHLVVDDWELVSADDTRLLGRLAAAGRVSGPGERSPANGRAVDADIATLVTARPARVVEPTDRVVVNPFGMGVHDIALADRVRAAAVEQGAGISLPR